jgi:hypothetical protein
MLCKIQEQLRKEKINLIKEAFGLPFFILFDMKTSCIISIWHLSRHSPSAPFCNQLITLKITGTSNAAGAEGFVGFIL